MAVHCVKCGARVASRAALAGHNRRAHPGKGRRSRARVPVRKPASAGAELVSIDSLSDDEIIRRFGRRVSLAVKSRPERPESIQAEIVDVTPSRSQIVCSVPESAIAGPIPGEAQIVQRSIDYSTGTLPSSEPFLISQLARGPLLIPQTDEVNLRAQYYFLKGLAARLDAGIASDRERAAFELGLREYNRHFERIAQRRVPPG